LLLQVARSFTLPFAVAANTIVVFVPILRGRLRRRRPTVMVRVAAAVSANELAAVNEPLLARFEAGNTFDPIIKRREIVVGRNLNHKVLGQRSIQSRRSR
jgi:hypothetical protein